MIRKLIYSILIFTLPLASAQDGTEEAIILNQEMQFLIDSANGIKNAELESSQSARRRQVMEESLEKTYFGSDEEDIVSTRTASPKRRGL